MGSDHRTTSLAVDGPRAAATDGEAKAIKSLLIRDIWRHSHFSGKIFLQDVMILPPLLYRRCIHFKASISFFQTNFCFLNIVIP